MTDSMNFGPEWLRNLSSEGSTTGVNSGGSRCQLAEYRYGREEMLALFEKGLQTPPSLTSFFPIYSETSLTPLALEPPTEEERQWASRGPSISMSIRGGRGVPGERGGRIARGGRGTYQPYGRSTGYETGGGWGNGDQTEWSPRKDFSYNRSSAGAVVNWRRNNRGEDDEGWRSSGAGHQSHVGGGGNEKWSRNSWREGEEDRGGQDKLGRSWHENQRGSHRRTWESETDHLPEWATENLEGGGTFDSTGAFHGSDDEQDGRSKKDHHLQKSVSQHNITNRNQHAPLSTSKSALSLNKPPSPTSKEKTNEKDESEIVVKEKLNKSINDPANENKMDNKEPPKQPETNSSNSREEPKKPIQKMAQFTNESTDNREADEDFDKLQEDLVLKLVVDEEPTTNTKVPPHLPLSNGIQPPPNIMPPMQEKWFYQDPQGDLQGPFLSTEMAEWFRAGYFTTNLFVRRQCDERFYTLGDLVALCGGNPFQTNVPIAPLKIETKLTEEMLQSHQLLQAQMALRQGTFGQGEPWNALNNIQQRELMAQQLLSQRLPESYLQQQNAVNPVLQMISQFHQRIGWNPLKMPVQPPVVDKPTTPLPCQLDTLKDLVQQMGGLQNMPNRMQQMGNHSQPLGTPAGLKHESSPLPSLHGLPANGIPGSSTIPVMPNNILGGLPNNPGLGKIESESNRNFLQFLQKPQMEQSHDLESMWRKPQFPTSQPNNLQTTSQWQSSDKPINMWDMPSQHNLQSHPDVLQINKDNTQNTKEKQINEATKEAAKEEKRRKELEEKQAKKEAEEKRKMEQKKLEAEKKQLEEKRKKEEDRIKRELEKAKKDAEEKRLKELAEKRRLKEIRKAEEEARKREELKRAEELEQERLAALEREEMQKKQAAEYARQAAINNQRLSKAAPWSQPSSNQGLSLAEIQRLERERKAAEAILQQQRLQQQQLQEQASPEKPSGIHLNWANKPMKLSQVKSLAEIQAEEQERLLKLKQANEKAMQKEKETAPAPTSGIWSGQSLNWNHDTNSNKGFWDEPVKPAVNKAPEPKLAKMSVPAPAKPANNKPTKSKSKKEANQNNNSSDEFSEWCTRTLSNMNTQVDIPTFISFLRDIESALDVREYCRDYLGDKPATQQFAAQFLEKRRSFKPKTKSHKDDMCSPAPAITPSSQHSTEFQEVKGKGKKCKKSKMLKMDNRILGFNVTAAQDRINVGDRDYGDT